MLTGDVGILNHEESFDSQAADLPKRTLHGTSEQVQERVLFGDPAHQIVARRLARLNVLRPMDLSFGAWPRQCQRTDVARRVLYQYRLEAVDARSVEGRKQSSRGATELDDAGPIEVRGDVEVKLVGEELDACNRSKASRLAARADHRVGRSPDFAAMLRGPRLC